MPGFVLLTVAMLEREPDLEEPVLIEYLSGNLCQRGSYLRILKAVRAAAQDRKRHSF
ncbi:2Fe-2S iron-sulfur cluster-binding protein [Thermoflexus sp.]|uniref:2Fe-2S iron-sulfur cluster-binding protein n=1 Tax=Thermoflexus sp. TaxID=1969742 RepID=UPI003A100170